MLRDGDFTRIDVNLRIRRDIILKYIVFLLPLWPYAHMSGLAQFLDNFLIDKAQGAWLKTQGN
jgi:hypothetical protein